VNARAEELYKGIYKKYFYFEIVKPRHLRLLGLGVETLKVCKCD
jgi:hypothetical protein